MEQKSIKTNGHDSLEDKSPTIDAALGSHSLGGIEHPLANRLMDFKKRYKKIRTEKVNWTYVKKLDGTIWSIGDLLNVPQYLG